MTSLFISVVCWVYLLANSIKLFDVWQGELSIVRLMVFIPQQEALTYRLGTGPCHYGE